MKHGNIYLLCCINTVIYLLLYYCLIIRSKRANNDERKHNKAVLMFSIGWILSVLSSILALFVYAVYIFTDF